MQTINSSKLEWEALAPMSGSYFQTLYCADGDGIIELVDYGDHYVLRDQWEIVKVFPKSEFDDEQTQHDELIAHLEAAQNYMAATYNAIFLELSNA